MSNELTHGYCLTATVYEPWLKPALEASAAFECADGPPLPAPFIVRVALVHQSITRVALACVPSVN
jgi:hypothetical protein